MNIDVTPKRALPGDYIRIAGEDLHFERDDVRCGVFFVDGSVARSPEYEVVSPELVIAKVPHGLSAGPYLLRLCRSADAQTTPSQSVFIIE